MFTFMGSERQQSVGMDGNVEGEVPKQPWRVRFVFSFRVRSTT